MKRSLLVSVVLVLAVVFSACSQAAPAPAPAPAQKAAEAPKPTEAPKPAAEAPKPAAAPTAAAAPKPAEQKPAAAAPVSIQWKAISGFAANYKLRQVIIEPFLAEIEKATQGQIKSTLVGPEAWPTFEQAKALHDGAFDIMISTPSYYENYIPGGSILNLNQTSTKLKRDVGLITAFDELYQRVGSAKFLANFSFGTPLHLYLRNKKITKLEDLRGLKVRSPDHTTPMAVALGMQPTMLAVTEVVPALERGVVDALLYPGIGFVDQKYHEVTKYIVFPGMGDNMMVAMVNIDSWNKLPKNLQTTIEDLSVKFEAAKQVEASKFYEEEQKVEAAAGMEKITLSKEDGEKMQNTFYDEYYKEIVMKRDPAFGTKMKAITDKLPK